jgi:hypothetical protein
MRKLSLLVGLTCVALAGAARAQAEAPAGEPAAATAAPSTEVAPAVPAAAVGPAKKMQVGLNLLPMVLGSKGTGATGDDQWADMSAAYGVGLSFGYNVIAGLSVGVAPQFLLHVKGKDDSDASKQIDLLARIAYAYDVMPKLAVYAEVLPGYSIILLPSSVTFLGEKPPSPKGLLIGFGAGAAYDVTDQIFASLGVGYQMGFQKMSVGGSDQDVKTKFLRIAIGGGVKF